MDFLDLAREVIDLRSFSNLWYWIVLAGMWSTLSHWVVGVPFDVVTRARRGHERATHDMHVLAEVSVNRILTIVDLSGTFIAGFLCFVLTVLAVTGWVYGIEFSQAVFLLFFPLTLVAGMTVYTARQLRAAEFDNFAHRLRMHRIGVQVLGVVFIFVTSFWGMWVNVRIGPWGL